MNSLGLVQGGACPFSGRGRAEDRYATEFFSLKADLAAHVCDQWFVLSERHGVVAPDEEVDGVDRAFTDLQPGEQARWAMDVVSDVASRVRKREYERVHVFADRPMREALKERGGMLSRVSAAGAETTEPLAGIGGQDRQEQWLREQLDIRRGDDAEEAPDPAAEWSD
ncbi:DUF6884 domain-containing protein [Halobaculum sp. D14]|uniref:DUF6884 domain-containing protein n=1 Tax=unclassified Halobaculum TaxID=2640896 RepID=UPI003EBA1125